MTSYDPIVRKQGATNAKFVSRIAVGLVGGLALGACVSPSTTGARNLSTVNDTGQIVAAQDEVETPKVEPRIEDFKIDLVVTSDECFGSADALTTVEPELAYTGSGFDGDYRLIYKINVSGGSSITDTIGISGDGSYRASEQMIDAPTCDPKLTVRMGDGKPLPV
jgi:hypothetical protein